MTLTTKNNKDWTLFVDGASRCNPGDSGAGFYILCNGVPVAQQGFFLGTKTNNQAEYLALIIGLLYLKEYVFECSSVLVMSDSQLMVRQLQGLYRVKDPLLRRLFSVAHLLMRDLGAHIIHVRRDQNSVADSMANFGIDQRVRISDEVLSSLHAHEVML